MSDHVLTVEKISKAIRRMEPEWIATIRDAETCTVKATSYLPDDGNLYVMNPPTFFIDHPWGAEVSGEVLVLCRPGEEETVREAVAKLRAER